MGVDYSKELAEALKQLGMTRAVLNAEHHSAGWRELAFFYLTQYPGQSFTSEDVREYAYSLGMPKPPDERAWGYVMTRAKNAGLILFEGMTVQRAPHCHKGYSTIWNKVKDTGIDLKTFNKHSQVYIFLIKTDFTPEKWALISAIHQKVGTVVGQKINHDLGFNTVEVVVPGHNRNCPELINARYLTSIEPGAELPTAKRENGSPGEQMTLL